MIGTVDGFDIGQYLNPFLAYKFQFGFPSGFVVLKLDLQTFLIIHAVFVHMLDLFDSFDEQLLGFDALTFAGLDASGTVEDGSGSAVLIEIFQTDNHQII
jgi:hypothetical protein